MINVNVTEEQLVKVLRDSLAWAYVYGEVIPAHQWDEMREDKVAQYVKTLKESADTTRKTGLSDLFAHPYGAIPAPR